jgi:hypothetical protein
MKKFTDQEIAQWLKYEAVRASGKYNMFDPRARAAAGLSSSECTFVMKNYSELAEIAKSTK